MSAQKPLDIQGRCPHDRPMTTTNFAASAAEWTTSELQAELQRPSVRKPRGRIQKEWRAAVDAELAKRS